MKYKRGDFAVIIRHADPAYINAVCRVYSMATGEFEEDFVILLPLSVTLEQTTVLPVDTRPAKTAEVVIYRKAGLI